MEARLRKMQAEIDKMQVKKDALQQKHSADLQFLFSKFEEKTMVDGKLTLVTDSINYEPETLRDFVKMLNERQHLSAYYVDRSQFIDGKHKRFYEFHVTQEFIPVLKEKVIDPGNIGKQWCGPLKTGEGRCGTLPPGARR